jgi:hypothetical protein
MGRINCQFLGVYAHKGRRENLQKLLQRILRKNGKKSPNDGKGGLQFLCPVLYYMRIRRYFAIMLKNDGRAVVNDFERGIF